MPRLPGFLERYRAVSVDLVMSDAFLDPLEQGVDVVVRIGELKDASLKARRVTVASPAYLALAGEFNRRNQDAARATA